MTPSIDPTLLVPMGQAILLGAFCFTLLQAIRGRDDMSLPFERLVIGMLALTLFQSAGSTLSDLSRELALKIHALSQDRDLKAILLEAFSKASSLPDDSGHATSFNLPAALEQAWRTGVWGVMSALVDGVFLIVSFVLECAQEVLWTLLLFLFPLAAGAYPVFPRLMTNLCIYAVELSLWMPILTLVELVTGKVAEGRLIQAGSWGLYLASVEIVSIFLILMIPNVTHRFLSGAFSGDFNSQSSVFVIVKQTAAGLRKPASAMGGSR